MHSHLQTETCKYGGAYSVGDRGGYTSNGSRAVSESLNPLVRTEFVAETVENYKRTFKPSGMVCSFEVALD